MHRVTLLCGLLALAGCRETVARAASAPALTPANDSALVRFRRSVPTREALVGGAEDREALVESFVTALARRDTAALRHLVLDAGEFAWLYYPTAREALPPYSLPPDLMWFRNDGLSQQGLAVALETLGGRHPRYAGHACPAAPRIEGKNRLWGYCQVRLLVDGAADTTTAGLFGLIVEREGRYKFVSYANQLD